MDEVAINLGLQDLPIEFTGRLSAQNIANAGFRGDGIGRDETSSERETEEQPIVRNNRVIEVDCYGDLVGNRPIPA
jgi:hypothetical protein